MSRISFALARRALLAAVVTAGMALCASSLAQVGEKAVRIVLPNATGSGVDAITRAAAVALAPYGVLVNGLAPGMMDTEMQRSTEASTTASSHARRSST